MRLSKPSLIVWGLMIALIIVSITIFLFLQNRPKLQTVSLYNDYTLQIVDEEKLQNMLSELRILETSGDKNIDIRLVTQENGKNVFLGENNQVISSSDNNSTDTTITVDVYIKPETLNSFEDHATGLFNHQLVATLLTFEGVGLAFNRINLDAVEGTTTQDKRLNYLLQKYFEDFPENKGNKYPIVINRK